jgi:hypothetical protein
MVVPQKQRGPPSPARSQLDLCGLLVLRAVAQMENWFLLIVTIVVGLLVLALSVYLIVIYQHPVRF